MAIDNNGGQNSKELSCGGDYTENQRREVSNSVENKDLSECTKDGKEDQIFNNKRVFQDKLDETSHLESDVGHCQADKSSPFIKTFHLVPLIRVAFFLDFSLSCSEETIAE